LAVNLVSVLGGLFLIGVALRDVFQGVIVPRAENTVLRVSRYVMRGLWRIWPWLALRLNPRDQGRREDFLATFAPFELMTILIIWVVMLVTGWGLFFYGLRDQLRPSNLSFDAALYYAGASLLTIGYGDIVAITPLTRVTSLLAAASGLGTVAVVTSFLFAAFGAFQNRERFVVAIGSRAGVPPSGAGLLAVHGYAGIGADLAQVFRDGQDWAAGVMETHLAYPILIMFRSSHDYESWVGTLGVLLDAAALVMAVLDPEHIENPQTQGQARIMYNIGRHLTLDFANYFGFQIMHPGPGVEQIEFENACRRLQDAGYAILDPQYAWEKFSHLRASYAPHLNALARWLEIPPVQWVGDRSVIAPAVPH
jgi:Ion channel